MTTPPDIARRGDAAIAVVFAVSLESDAFARLATAPVELGAGGLVIHEGHVAGRRVAWCTAGAGGAAAARAARLLIDGHRPALLVSAGFAGGLDPALPRGAVVRAGVALAPGAPPLPLAGGDAGTTIVTVDRVVASVADKRALAAATGARLVDMETHAVAAVARDAGLPCGSLRVISDAAGDELPREVVALARPQSLLRRLGTAVGAVGRRPAAALDLWRLYEHAVDDGRTLAAALAALCGGSSPAA